MKRKSFLNNLLFLQVKGEKKTVQTCKTFSKKQEKKKLFVKRKYASFSPIINSIMENIQIVKINIMPNASIENR